MKKLLSLITILALVFSLASIFASAAEGEFSLLPDDNDEVTVTGATYVINSDGSVTITMTAATAILEVLYKDTTVYTDKKSNLKEDTQFVVWSYEKTGSVDFSSVLAKYARGNNNDADLFLSGMKVDAASFLVSGKQGDTFGAWDFTGYLNSGDGARMPADGVITFNKITYTLLGAIGDTMTIFRYNLVSEVPDDLGTETLPSDESSDISDDSSIVSADSSVEDSSGSIADSSTTTPTSQAPGTGSTGFAAFAIISVIACAGVAIVKKSR